MKERPINMRPDEVRAILDGRKTQFRRVMRTQPRLVGDGVPYGDRELTGLPSCQFGAPGDRLWVKERWAYVTRTAYRCSDGVIQTADPSDPDMSAVYAAGRELSPPSRWRSSVHMPRWASRITLEVASVRVERLQDISEEDAIAEGVGKPIGGVFFNYLTPTPLPTGRESYRTLWQSINGPRSWDENPFVWAVEFRRLEVPNE